MSGEEGLRRLAKIVAEAAARCDALLAGGAGPRVDAALQALTSADIAERECELEHSGIDLVATRVVALGRSVARTRSQVLRAASAYESILAVLWAVARRRVVLTASESPAGKGLGPSAVDVPELPRLLAQVAEEGGATLPVSSAAAPVAAERVEAEDVFGVRLAQGM